MILKMLSILVACVALPLMAAALFAGVLAGAVEHGHLCFAAAVVIEALVALSTSVLGGLVYDWSDRQGQRPARAEIVRPGGV